MERFIIAPNIHMYGGIEIKKDTKFEEKTESGEVTQTFKDGFLVTKCNRTSEFNGIESVENSVMTQNIPVGTILVWNKEAGYVIPQYKMSRVKEAIKDLKIIKE